LLFFLQRDGKIARLRRHVKVTIKATPYRTMVSRRCAYVPLITKEYMYRALPGPELGVTIEVYTLTFPAPTNLAISGFPVALSLDPGTLGVVTQCACGARL
jgi:hypothetical protein